MSYGKRSASRIQTSDQPMSSMDGTADAGGDDSGSMGNLAKSISPLKHKSVAEDQPDQHRAKSAVGRRMQYVRDVYNDGGGNMKSIGICVARMIPTREADVQGKSTFSISLSAEKSSGRTDGRPTYMMMGRSACSTALRQST